MTTPAARPARRPVPRSVAVALFVALALALGACGFNYQTDAVYQAAPGTNDRTGQVNVLNAVVVSSQSGQGTFVASLANGSQTKSDQLTKISAADGSSGVTATLGSPIEIKPGDLVNLADQGGISVSGDSVSAGGWVKLTLQFGSGQSTTMGVPVVSNQNQWASISPSSSPSGSPSSSPSGSSSTSPSSSPSESPSGSSSASPSATP